MAEEVMTPESVHRSPFSCEIVEPDKAYKLVHDERRGRMTEVQEAADNDPLRLYSSDTNPANIPIIHEKPEHRFIIYLKARGMSNREVCEKLNYTDGHMSQIVRQPWFRIRLVQELREAGLNKIAKLLESTAYDSVFTLVNIRDDETAPKAVRRACADSLLDRYLGRATVHVARDADRVPSTPEIHAVDTELQEIEKQLKETNNAAT